MDRNNARKTSTSLDTKTTVSSNAKLDVFLGTIWLGNVSMEKTEDMKNIKTGIDGITRMTTNEESYALIPRSQEMHILDTTIYDRMLLELKRLNMQLSVTIEPIMKGSTLEEVIDDNKRLEALMEERKNFITRG